jgi:hypothetical protein
VSLAAGAVQALGETRDACPLPQFTEIFFAPPPEISAVRRLIGGAMRARTYGRKPLKSFGAIAKPAINGDQIRALRLNDNFRDCQTLRCGRRTAGLSHDAG